MDWHDVVVVDWLLVRSTPTKNASLKTLYSCTTLHLHHHHPINNNNNNNHSNNKMIVLLGDGGSEPTEGRGAIHVLRCIKGSVFSEAFLERASQAKHRLSCGCARNYCHVLRRIKVGAF
eukprot:scaffold1124_cov88-Skeletonema_marinoi.AAC.4